MPAWPFNTVFLYVCHMRDPGVHIYAPSVQTDHIKTPVAISAVSCVIWSTVASLMGEYEQLTHDRKYDDFSRFSEPECKDLLFSNK